MFSRPIIYKNFKDFTNRKKTNRVVAFSQRPLLNIPKKENHSSTNLKSSWYWNNQLLYMIDQGNSSPEIPLEYNQNHMNKEQLCSS